MAIVALSKVAGSVAMLLSQQQRWTSPMLGQLLVVRVVPSWHFMIILAAYTRGYFLWVSQANQKPPSLLTLVISDIESGPVRSLHDQRLRPLLYPDSRPKTVLQRWWHSSLRYCMSHSSQWHTPEYCRQIVPRWRIRIRRSRQCPPSRRCYWASIRVPENGNGCSCSDLVRDCIGQVQLPVSIPEIHW